MRYALLALMLLAVAVWTVVDQDLRIARMQAAGSFLVREYVKERNQRETCQLELIRST